MNMVKKLRCLSIILGLCSSPVYAKPMPGKPEKKLEQSSTLTSKFVKVIFICAIVGAGLWYLRKRKGHLQAPIQPEVPRDPEIIKIEQVLGQAQDILVTLHYETKATNDEILKLLQAATCILKKVPKIPPPNSEFITTQILLSYFEESTRLIPSDGNGNKRASLMGLFAIMLKSPAASVLDPTNPT